jgi:SAM-dependent methyltransferase
MTEKDQIKWDARYSKDLGNTEPSSILLKYCHLSSVGKALDIACGKGRNSMFLAEKGFVVDAVDISKVATDQLAGKHQNINAICTDLDTWNVQSNHYDLIVNIRFLERRLFPMIHDGLKSGGLLIFESFLDGKRETYRLKQNELLRAFHAFRIVYYEEKGAQHAEKIERVASLVAIKPESVVARSK